MCARPVCESCGDPAIVHRSEHPAGAGVRIRHFCLKCSDASKLHPQGADRNAPHHLSDCAVLMGVGSAIVVLSLFADQIQSGHSAGFGWVQIAAGVIGLLLLFIGSVIRSPLLLALGSLIAVLALLADLVPFGNAPGFGSRQRTGVVFGSLVLATGMGLAIRRRFHPL